jgi:hypothetical protein
MRFRKLEVNVLRFIQKKPIYDIQDLRNLAGELTDNPSEQCKQFQPDSYIRNEQKP